MGLFELFGLIGAMAYIAAYMIQQFELSDNKRLYLYLNLTGSIFIICSLYELWNLPSAVSNGFWLAATTYGLLRS